MPGECLFLGDMDAELWLRSVVVSYTFGGWLPFMVSEGDFEQKSRKRSNKIHRSPASAHTRSGPRAREDGSGGGRRGRKFRSADGGGGAAALERPGLPNASSRP